MSKNNGIDPKLTADLNDAITSYVSIFEKKHDIELDYWTAEKIGTIGSFGDYYINFEDIRLDLEKSVPKDIFFKWYDLSLNLAMEEKPTINYYTYLKLNNDKT